MSLNSLEAGSTCGAASARSSCRRQNFPRTCTSEPAHRLMTRVRMNFEKNLAFPTHFSVSGNQMKHSVWCMIYYILFCLFFISGSNERDQLHEASVYSYALSHAHQL